MKFFECRFDPRKMAYVFYSCETARGGRYLVAEYSISNTIGKIIKHRVRKKKAFSDLLKKPRGFVFVGSIGKSRVNNLKANARTHD
jgi:hypothetical protein